MDPKRLYYIYIATRRPKYEKAITLIKAEILSTRFFMNRLP